MGSCTPFKTKFWLNFPVTYLATMFMPGVGPKEPLSVACLQHQLPFPAGRTSPRGREFVVGVTEGRSLCVGGEGPLAGVRLPDGRPHVAEDLRGGQSCNATA